MCAWIWGWFNDGPRVQALSYLDRRLDRRGCGHCSLVLPVEPSNFRAVQYESDSTIHQQNSARTLLPYCTLTCTIVRGRYARSGIEPTGRFRTPLEDVGRLCPSVAQGRASKKVLIPLPGQAGFGPRLPAMVLLVWVILGSLRKFSYGIAQTRFTG